MTKRLALIPAFVLLAATAPRAQQTTLPATTAVVVTPPLESYLELLRQQAGIPGMSGALVQDGQIVWERGFGFQNQESRVRATPDTPYLVADISETFAAVLLLQCVEERRLELNEPIRSYGGSVPETAATLRQVMSHTSASGGESFRYDPERFAQLTMGVEWCAPQPYRKSIAHRILERLAMKDSVPGRDLQDKNIVPEGLFDPAALDRYAHVLERLATPYKIDRKGRASRSDVPSEGINAATGLVSTVRDLARFDGALDSALLLREDTIALAWTNAVASDRTPLPMGLGWFVQSYKGEPLVWHFGLIPNAYSSLILKLPKRHLTLILLANSDGLAVPFQLELGDVTRSVFATVFLRLFV